MPRILDSYGLPALLQERLEMLLAKKLCTMEDLEGRVLSELASMPEQAALAVLREFQFCDLSAVSTVYIICIIFIVLNTIELIMFSKIY